MIVFQSIALLFVALMFFVTAKVTDQRFTMGCADDDECHNREDDTSICENGRCLALREFGENCDVNRQCTGKKDEKYDENKICSAGKCGCQVFWQFNETTGFCEEYGCKLDKECEGELVCRNHACVLKGKPRPGQPTPEAVFVVVAAILGGVVSVTVAVVVIKSRLFKKSRRRTTMSLLHNE
jgi:hypothetical protein